MDPHYLLAPRVDHACVRLLLQHVVAIQFSKEKAESQRLIFHNEVFMHRGAWPYSIISNLATRPLLLLRNRPLRSISAQQRDCGLASGHVDRQGARLIRATVPSAKQNSSTHSGLRVLAGPRHPSFPCQHTVQCPCEAACKLPTRVSIDVPCKYGDVVLDSNLSLIFFVAHFNLVAALFNFFSLALSIQVINHQHRTRVVRCRVGCARPLIPPNQYVRYPISPYHQAGAP